MGWKKGQAVRLVPPSEATGRVLEVYRDMQRTLGVPHISSFFQFLGTQPRFLDRFWTSIRPLAQSQAFFSCANRLRAGAYTRVHSYFQVPDLKSEIIRLEFNLGAQEELKDCINFFCYSVPMSLLFASLLSESFEGPVGNPNVPLTPAPSPKPHRHIIMVEEDTARPTVKEIFADIRSSTDSDVVHTVYRAFARWPDFLQSYWTGVKPITVSQLFQHCGSLVREDALQLVGELPGPVEFNSYDLSELGMRESEVGSLIRITDMFVHSLSTALLNVNVARIAIDGGNVRPKSTPEDAGTTAAQFPSGKTL